MKHPFFKSILVLGAALALVNCSEDTTTSPYENQNAYEQGVPDYCWVLNADQTLLIFPTGVVTDLSGTPVGQANAEFTVITTLDGTQFIVTDLNVGALTMLNPGDQIPTNSILPFSSATVTTPISSATIGGTTPMSSAAIGVPASSAIVRPTSSTTLPKSSSSVQPQQGSDGTCYDKYSGKYVKPNTENRGPNNEAYAYSDKCEFQCWWSSDNNQCSALLSSQGTQQQQQPKSSSSQQQQQQKSSSSQQQQSGGGCPVIKYVNGGMSGSGHATRYWDCAKPSCAWPENANQGTGKMARQCGKDGVTLLNDPSAPSALDGGNATTCKSQTAFTINGCDNIGFAFAATPGNNSCGKCFELTFTGEGKYETKTNHQKLKGKKLIVMASNIGGDVSSGQFDIMIPGGGVGIKNACGNIGFNQGTTTTHGGMLSDCENEVGYNGDVYSKRKECLTKKCNATFSGDALKGCLFLADFMEAAGNPLHTFKQVECPQVLLDKY